MTSQDGYDPMGNVTLIVTFENGKASGKMYVGGYCVEVKVDGKVTSLEELNELATIPSREGLLTMLAGGLIGTVKDLSIALNLLSEQKEEN